jgi:UDP-N-acetylmuramoylalanine--D-glutamate ligase
MKTALVIGLGVSGEAAAQLLVKKGFSVTVFDDKIKKGPWTFVENPREVDLASFDLVIASPGISPHHSLYARALSEGKKVIGEMELGMQCSKQKAIAITGTNGKTTVTSLIAHILNASGIPARALGNIGTAISSYFLDPHPEEVLVVEVSSFQLETLNTPCFDIGIILNITPDHLDRYEGMREYAAAKCRLVYCLKEGGTLIVGKEIAAIYGDLLCNFQTYDEAKGNNEAAWKIAARFGISQDQFNQALATFKIGPHRIEFVAKINGIAYYNDSKGTNVDAVIYALDRMASPVVLIAGGLAKKSSFTYWREKFNGRVRSIVAMGEAKEQIKEELGETTPVILAENLREAVGKATQIAAEGECVLLSPGCASLDMFQNYADRGDQFKQCVLELGGIDES